MGTRESAEAGVETRTHGGLDPRIVVAGCGGAGCNVVSQVYEKELPGVETLAVNADPGSLERTRADVRILLAQGVSVDGDPVLAAYAAEASRDLLRAALSADIAFLVAGMGGATGTGAMPVLASAAKEAGAHTVAIVILPFRAEGRAPFEDALTTLKDACDSVVILDNNNLERLGAELTLAQAFDFVNRVVLTIVEGVVENVTGAALTSIFDEVESVTREVAGEPEATLPVEVATPVVEALQDYTPVGFDDTGFIGLR